MPPPCHGQERGQLNCKFACSSRTQRAKTLRLQICWVGTEVPIYVCCHIQPLQRPSPSHDRQHTSATSGGIFGELVAYKCSGSLDEKTNSAP